MHFVRPERPVALQLVSGQGHYEAVIESVVAARRSVWIATANLKELMIEGGGGARRRRRFRSVLAAFADLSESGVDLRILHAAMPSRAFRDHFDAQPALVAGGLELRKCPRVHMKLVIIDGERAYFGSANWTGAGLGAKGADRRNFELGAVTSDALVLDDLQAHFDQVWRGDHCPRCRLRDRCDAPLDT